MNYEKKSQKNNRTAIGNPDFLCADTWHSPTAVGNRTGGGGQTTRLKER